MLRLRKNDVKLKREKRKVWTERGKEIGVVKNERKGKRKEEREIISPALAALLRRIQSAVTELN